MSVVAGGAFALAFGWLPSPTMPPGLLQFLSYLLVAAIGAFVGYFIHRRLNRHVFWLSDLADDDAKSMEQRVYFYTHPDILGEPKLVGTTPFIEFHQPMINASVLPVTFQTKVDGRLYIDAEEQRDKLEIRETPPQSLEVRRGAYHDLAFRQWLSPEVASKMQDQPETSFDFGHTAVYFTFEHRGSRQSVRKALGNQVTWRRLPMRPHPLVDLRMWSLDPRVPDSDTQIEYKAKLTLVLTNESGRPIRVLQPQFHGVAVQFPFAYGYRVESSLHGWKHSQWNKELSEADVDSGWSFKLWLGLDPSIPHKELEKKRDERSLGTLSIPIEIGRQAYTLQYFV